MKRQVVLTIFASVLIASQAFAGESTSSVSAELPQPSSNAGSLSANLGFLSYLYNDNTNPSQMAGMQMLVLGKYRFDDQLSGNFEIGVQAETGNSQVVYNNNYQAQNEFYLTEAALNFQVTDDVLLRGGAFAQGKYENPLLFGPTISFPGVQQAVSFYRDSSGFFQLQAEEAIPSSQMTTPVPTQGQGMPSFLTAGPILKFGQLAADPVSGSVHARYFSFSNLPVSVAQASRFRGNDVSGIGDQGAEFLYGFQGAETAANFKLNLSSDFKPFVQGAAIMNFDAPSGSNQGFLTKVGADIKVSPKVILTPAVEYFYIQADAAPAFYNDPAYGNTNYQGLALSAQVTLPISGLMASVRYASASYIQENPYQNNFSLITIQLGKSYAIF